MERNRRMRPEGERRGSAKRNRSRRWNGSANGGGPDLSRRGRANWKWRGRTKRKWSGSRNSRSHRGGPNLRRRRRTKRSRRRSPKRNGRRSRHHCPNRSGSDRRRRSGLNNVWRRRRKWNKSGKCRGDGDRSLLHDNRRADRRVLEKRLGHSLRQTNAAVRSRVRWHVPLMHRVSAPEKHGEGHAGAIVMAAGRSRILARIDIRFHDVPKIVHVIAEHRRNVLLVFGDNGVIAGRCAEPWFAGRDRGFTDEMFAFIKIGVLLGDADDDFW